MNTNIETQIIKVKDIKLNPRNPKKHWVEKISESIKEMGYVEPIVVDENNMILAGHGRLKALKENGFEEIEVIIKRGLTEKQKEKYMLLSNKLVEAGGWDLDLLKEFDESSLLDSGFNDEDMDQIFGLEIDDNFDLNKEIEKITHGKRRVKNGDLWELGNHKLFIGDCTKEKSWKILFGNEKYDFLFSDPPYRIGYGIGNRKQKTKEGMVIQKFRTYETIGPTTKNGKPLKNNPPNTKFGFKQNREYLGVKQLKGVPEYDEWLSIANRYQNPIGANIMIFENWRNTVGLWQAIEKYWKIRNMVIWFLPNRCQGFSAKHKFFSKYDIAPLADKGRAVHNEGYEEELEKYLETKGQRLLDTYEVILYGQKGKSYWDKKKGTRWAKVNDHISWTAATGSSSGQSVVFGTKPLPVLVPFVKILSPRNGIVADPFAGSGSTILASEIMHRKCHTIEISDIYGEVIINRFERFTNLKAKKL